MKDFNLLDVLVRLEINDVFVDNNEATIFCFNKIVVWQSRWQLDLFYYLAQIRRIDNLVCVYGGVLDI